MSLYTLAVLSGIFAALALDIAGAAAATRGRVKYATLAPVSCAIYAIVGAVVGATYGLVAACFAAATVGFTDATLGWRLSWLLGPGKPAPELATFSRVAAVIALVTFGAAGFGFTGALFWQRFIVGST